MSERIKFTIPYYARRWLRFGRYAKSLTTSQLRHLDVPSSIRLYTRSDLRRALKLIRQSMYRGYWTNTRDIRLSRLVSARQAISMRLTACGAMTTLVVSVFRTKGLPAKIVDGMLKARGTWGRHAWTELWVPAEGKFVPMDIFSSTVTPHNHRRFGTYLDWSESGWRKRKT